MDIRVNSTTMATSHRYFNLSRLTTTFVVVLILPFPSSRSNNKPRAGPNNAAYSSTHHWDVGEFFIYIYHLFALF